MNSSKSVDMSFENHFQELALSAISDDRKKLDGFRLFGTESPQEMKSPSLEMNQISIPAEPKYNVRKSLAWDSAFFTSPGVLEPEELFQSVNSQIVDNAADIFGHGEEILLPSGSLEPQVTKRSNRCDLRKSLAWDEAFFTNAGVLDPEELSMVNKGLKKPETHLPGIEEDVSRSTESSLSIDSGTSSLTSLEIDLFEDIRESWHKSTNKLSVSVSSLELQKQKASNKLDASRTMMDMPARGRQNINPNAARCTKKTYLSAPSQKRHAAGNSSLSVKPPKSAGRVKNTPAVSTIKASCSASFAKVGTSKAASGEVRLTNPKKINLGSSNSNSHCSSSSPASSSSGFPAAAQKLVSCSLSNSNSVLKTPLRHSRRNKTKLESSCHPSHELSMTKSSYCTSPDSSIDGWSSESSSTSTKRSSNPKAFMGTTCRQVYFQDIALQKSALSQNLPNQSLAGHGSQERRLMNHTRKAPFRTVSLPSHKIKNTKPSGLRAPSPKLGYFDAENSSVAIKDGSTKSHSGKQIAMLKVGSCISDLNGPANQPKTGITEISRTIAGTQKQNEVQNASQIIHKHPIQVEEVPLNETATRATVKICFPMTYRVQNGLPQRTSCKDCLGLENLGIEGRGAATEGVQFSSNAESKCFDGPMENNLGTKHKEKIIQSANKNTLEECEMYTHFKGNNLHIPNDSKKENVYSFKDQVDGASKHVSTIDLGGDVVIELKIRNSTAAQSAVLTLKI